MCLNIYFCREQQLTGSLSQMAENISSAVVPFSLPWWDDGYQALLGWLLFQLRQLWGRGWERPAGEAQRSFSYSTNSSRTVAIKFHECLYHSPLLKREGRGNTSRDLLQICFIGHPSAVSLRFSAGRGAAMVGLHPAPSFPVPHCLCCPSKKTHVVLLAGASTCCRWSGAAGAVVGRCL